MMTPCMVQRRGSPALGPELDGNPHHKGSGACSGGAANCASGHRESMPVESNHNCRRSFRYKSCTATLLSLTQTHKCFRRLKFAWSFVACVLSGARVSHLLCIRPFGQSPSRGINPKKLILRINVRNHRKRQPAKKSSRMALPVL